MSALPLFPLNTVLFPSTPIQLHIFEERYLQMARLCMEAALPFGVILIRKGYEANGPLAQPYDIGVTAKIANVETREDGTLEMVAVGQERFRVLSLDYETQPYLQGEVEDYPLLITDPAALEQIRVRLGNWLGKYLKILLKAGAIQLGLQELPEDPLVLGYLAAAVIQIIPEQKQKILEIERAEDMLETLITLYKREVALVQVTLTERNVPMTGSFPEN